MENIKRELSTRISGKIFQGKAIVIIGARQVGKTTLLKHLEQPADNILWMNADEMEIQMLMQNISVEKFRSLIGKHSVVIIDEAQRIQNIGLKAKLITDNFPDVQLFLTGSSSLDLANKVNEPLTGRKWEYTLFPLSFAELAAHHGMLQEYKKLPIRLVFGCYPEVVCNPGNEKEILNSLADSYLYKDILAWDRIKRPDKLVKLLQALSYQIGSEVSTNELSRTVELDRTTVENYINLLEQAQVIFRLPSYSRNLRSELKASRKIYFHDNGIRNAVIGNFSDIDMRTDVGILWENWMISELVKRKNYRGTFARSYFWRTVQQQEIDYLEETDGHLTAYEFKWNNSKLPRLSKTFSNSYPDHEYRVVNRENYMEILL